MKLNLFKLIFLLLLLSCGKHTSKVPYIELPSQGVQTVITRTPEELALNGIQNDNIDEVQFAINQESLDPNFIYPDSLSILMVAIKWKRLEIIEFLLTFDTIDKEYVDSSGKDALAYAEESEVRQIISLFKETLSQEEINAQLFEAINNLDVNLLRESIELGAELNIFDSRSGLTPLTLAIFKKDLNIVRVLLQTRKVDINLADKRRKWTPLRWAEETGQDRLASLLRRQGAN